MRLLITLFALVFALTGCTSSKSVETAKAESADETSQTSTAATDPAPSHFTEPAHGTAVPADGATYQGYARALFAGGCFWCMETPFEKIDGVVAVISGFAGGSEKNPSYKDVAYGRTGHTESVLVVYDPSRVSYEKLLDVFWRNHDPTDAGGQFVDRGSQYRPVLFVYDADQRAAAEKSREALEKSGRFDKPLATRIVDATTFWPAEKYHQDFYKKEPAHYKRYRSGSGRDQFLGRIWKK
jgi:methionine-S-sulfoxide reductase